MKLEFLLIISTLLLSGTCQEVQLEETMAQLQASDFGQDILKTMALEMESEGAPEDKVRQIIDLLQKLERGLEDDQREDDAKLQNDKSDCEEFIDRLDDQLNQFKSRINELQLQIDENTSIKNIKVRSLEEKQQILTQVKAEISDLSAENDVRAEQWQSDQENFDQTQYVLQRAKEIISGNLASSSGVSTFIQTDREVDPIKMSNLAQISEHFANNAQNIQPKRKSWTAFFQLLAQMTAEIPVHADQAKVKRIIDLIDELLHQNENSREIERTVYQVWYDQYTQQMAALAKRVNKAQGDVDYFSGRINDLDIKLGNDHQDKRDLKKSFTAVSTERNEKATVCDDIYLLYDKTRTSREDKRQLISGAIKLISANYRALRQWVTQNKY